MDEFVIATNNGDLGGGEVMLLNLARAAADLGCRVTVVAPSMPSPLLQAARTAGHRVVEVRATDRLSWMRGLRAWDRAERRSALLWCNGLVPALATAGHRDRVVHLHQFPRPRQRPAVALARRGALATVVPLPSLAARLTDARVLPNWTRPIHVERATAREGRPVRVGFLGRHSPDKGLVVLADAIARLDRMSPGSHRLWLAGGPRFVSSRARRAVEEALAPINHLVDRPGWVSPEEFFTTVDVAAFPSVAPESFGLVAAEAMSTRTPFIVSDVPGLSNVVGPDYPLMVRAGDADELARAIELAPDTATPHILDAAYLRWTQLFSSAAGQQNLGAELTRLGLITGEADR